MHLTQNRKRGIAKEVNGMFIEAVRLRECWGKEEEKEEEEEKKKEEEEEPDGISLMDLVRFGPNIYLYD